MQTLCFEVRVKNPRSNLYGYAYDSLQRLVQTTNEDGAVVNVTRDGNYGASALNYFLSNALHCN